MATLKTKKDVALKYRQDKSWVVSIWTPRYNSYYLMDGLTYSQACEAVRNARKAWDTKKQAYKEA